MGPVTGTTQCYDHFLPPCSIHKQQALELTAKIEEALALVDDFEVQVSAKSKGLVSLFTGHTSPYSSDYIPFKIDREAVQATLKRLQVENPTEKTVQDLEDYFDSFQLDILEALAELNVDEQTLLTDFRIRCREMYGMRFTLLQRIDEPLRLKGKPLSPELQRLLAKAKTTLKGNLKITDEVKIAHYIDPLCKYLPPPNGYEPGGLLVRTLITNHEFMGPWDWLGTYFRTRSINFEFLHLSFLYGGKEGDRIIIEPEKPLDWDNLLILRIRDPQFEQVLDKGLTEYLDREIIKTSSHSETYTDYELEKHEKVLNQTFKLIAAGKTKAS